MGTSSASRRRPRTPSLGAVFVSIPLIIVAWAASRPISDNSFLWHVRAGDAQRALGEVLRTDPFSYTMFGKPWRTQSWLADLGYSLLHEWFGLAFTPWMVATVGFLIWVALGVSIHRGTGSALLTSIAGAAVMFLVGFYLVPRPVMFSLLLFALLMTVVHDERVAWTAPLLIWLWSALHGSWILGVGVVFLATLWRTGMPRIRRALASFGAVHLTAHGVAVWWILFEFLRNRSTVRIMQEWRTPDFTQPVNLIFVALLAALLTGAARQRILPRDLWLIVPLVVLGLSSQRALVVATVGLAGFDARAFSGVGWTLSRGVGAVNATFMAVFAAAALLAISSGGERLDPEMFPVVASKFVTTLDGVVHDDAAGGYLIYERWPEELVFIDDRAELFGELLNDWTRVRSGAAPSGKFLDEVGAEAALLRSDDPLVWVLREKGWLARFADARWTVLHRP